MEVVGGIAREVRRETEVHPVPGGEPRRVEKVVFRVGTKTVELYMLPLPDVQDGDEIIVVGDPANAVRRDVSWLAYDNRTRDTHGRHPTWTFVRRTLKCFAAIALLGSMSYLLRDRGAGGLSLLLLLLVAVGWLYVLAFELRCRKALSLAFTADITSVVEAEKRQLAEQQAVEKKRQDEVERRNKLLPIERAIEDYYNDAIPSEGGSKQEKVLSLAVPNDPAAFRVLIAMLDDPLVSKRSLAADLLGKIRNPAAIQALLKTYSGPPPKDEVVTYKYKADADDTDYSYDTETIPGSVLLERERTARDIAAIRCGHPFQKVASELSLVTIRRLTEERLIDSASAVAVCAKHIVDGREATKAVEWLVDLDPGWFETPAGRAVDPKVLFPPEAMFSRVVICLANVLVRIGDRRALDPLRSRLSRYHAGRDDDVRNAILHAIAAIETRHPAQKQ